MKAREPAPGSGQGRSCDGPAADARDPTAAKRERRLGGWQGAAYWQGAIAIAERERVGEGSEAERLLRSQIEPSRYGQLPDLTLSPVFGTPPAFTSTNFSAID